MFKNITGRMRAMEDDDDGSGSIVRELRNLPPSHYIFKIENFSLLSYANSESFQSSDFEVGGYKWNLCLYPKGNKKRNGDGYISLYLVLSKSNQLHFCQEVNVIFKLFIYDGIRDKYLTVQDGKEKVKRFHGIKAKWGFNQLVSIKDFNNASNGYLMDDCCMFGAEIFVIENAHKGECLSMVKKPANNTYLKIKNFAELQEECIRSQVFSVGGNKWTLLVYPKGDSLQRDKSLSVFLRLEDYANSDHRPKLYAEYVLRVRDQLKGEHHENTVTCEFHSYSNSWGYSNFMPLDDLNNKLKGFLVNDALIVEVQFLVMTVFKGLS